MADRKEEMQAIFNGLSEANKDIVLLVAKGIKVAQDTAQPAPKPPKQTA